MKMIKKTIYPKTQRVSCTGTPVVITEKLDGSNLCFFKLNDELYIAQRNNIFKFTETCDNKEKLYSGLYQWVNDNYEALNKIRNGSVVCGEWLGMGRIKYPFEKRFYMFAKANIDESFNLNCIYYDHSLFKYPFEDLEIPECIGTVPIVDVLNFVPNKEALDALYEVYTKEVGRDVEGFVVNVHDTIKKYVRMKNGKLEEHFDREGK